MVPSIHLLSALLSKISMPSAASINAVTVKIDNATVGSLFDTISDELDVLVI